MEGKSASRVLRTAPIVGGRALVLIYLFVGWIPVFCVLEVVQTRQPVDEVVQQLAVAAMGVFILGWLTWSWIEHRRFGDSVCTLLTFPVVIGGPLEADVECGLPPGSREPVTVRLVNQVPAGKSFVVRWQTEIQVEADALRPGAEGRSVVPVRLRIPEHPGAPASPRLPAGYGSRWVLALDRKVKRIDFHAEFVVPVADAAVTAADAAREE